MIHNLEKGYKVCFFDDKAPYDIMAISERYAVCTRKLMMSADADILRNRVKMSAYSTIEKAYLDLKEHPVYTLVDFKSEKRSSDNYGTKFNYGDPSECEECLKELHSEAVELSRRNIVDLQIDWEKTNLQNAIVMQECESCNQDFDMDIIQYDAGDNPLCPECYKMVQDEAATWVCKGCGATGRSVEWCWDNWCQTCEDKTFETDKP